MSNGNNRNDALMREWETLQTELQQYKSHYHRRIITGTTALALVAGYALLAEVELLLIFIPIIIGLIFILHVQETNNVYYRQWQCYRIEEKLSANVDWTHKFSGLARANPEHKISTMNKVFGYPMPYLAAGAAIFTGLVVYVGFAIYSVYVVLPTFISLNRIVVWIIGTAFYLILLMLLVVVGRSHKAIRKEFRQEELE